MVQRLRDMFGKAGLDGEFGMVLANEEGEWRRSDDAVSFQVSMLLCILLHISPSELEQHTWRSRGWSPLLRVC